MKAIISIWPKMKIADHTDEQPRARRYNVNIVPIHDANVRRLSNTKGLKHHKAKICRFSPKDDRFAIGLNSSIAMVYNFRNSDRRMLRNELFSDEAVLLRHTSDSSLEKVKAVTDINWNNDGTMVATGNRDGIARVFSNKGTLEFTTPMYNKGGHRYEICAVRFNKVYKHLLLTAGDKVNLWDATTGTGGELIQSFDFHTEYVTGIDWMDEDTFFSFGDDSVIHICRVGGVVPLKTFTNILSAGIGFTHVKYNPKSWNLATTGSDNSIKIWSCRDDGALLHTFYNTNVTELEDIKWGPQGNVLACHEEASCEVKLYDTRKGELQYILDRHQARVTSIVFSPDGRFIASGDVLQCICIWEVQSAKLIRYYERMLDFNPIVSMDWSYNGHKIGAVLRNSEVILLDVRKAQFKMRHNCNYKYFT